MSEIKVNSIKGVGASAAAITVNNTDGTCIANITNKPNRNLIINGAMQVAQRGTSSTSSNYQTVDRFITGHGGTDESPTQAQHALTSSDTGPYAEGFRFSYHITNGNQTSGAGAADNIYIRQRIEAQNVAQSGWNYTSSSSYITLSFWVKSSVAQNFYGYLRTADGTSQRYAFETGSLSANTWTKITKTISGNSNLQFDDNNENGLEVVIIPFWGTDQTDSGVALNAWGAFSSTTRTPDYGTAMDDWYLANDATFELTGVQLEVSDHATSFEHRSFGQELQLCKRYYQMFANTNQKYSGLTAFYYTNSHLECMVRYEPEMRAAPSLDQGTGTDYFGVYVNNQLDQFSGFSAISGDKRAGSLDQTSNISGTAGHAGGLFINNANAYIAFTAEL